MAQVLVRDLDSDVLARLKERAKRNGRSLQSELKATLEKAARSTEIDSRALAAKIRRQLSGRSHSDTVDLLAEDRAR